ncbi:MAG: MarR family winged helix-turn-helix transcriptional regulator [Prevotella sp.]
MKIPSQQLDDEMSFKLYMLNRLIQQEYQVFLAPLHLTYPQYLVMKILMEGDGIPVNVITSRLMLESNTVTPILQRLEKQGLIKRGYSCNDQRQRIITLTDQGKDMRQEIADVSSLVAESLREKDTSCETAHRLESMLGSLSAECRLLFRIG